MVGKIVLTNKRKNSIIIFAFSIVFLVSISVVLASSGVFKTDGVENTPKLPDSGVESNLNMDRPEDCIPLPKRSVAIMDVTRTPTLARNETGMEKIVFISPTVYSYTKNMDLQPEGKENDKFKVVVFTCDGKTNLYYGINKDDFDFINKQMGYGDVILDMESPASLMQRKVPDPVLSETEKTQIPVTTNTATSYPSPTISASKIPSAVLAYP